MIQEGKERKVFEYTGLDPREQFLQTTLRSWRCHGKLDDVGIAGCCLN